MQFSSPGPRSIAGPLRPSRTGSPLPCDVYVWADQLWQRRVAPALATVRLTARATGTKLYRPAAWRRSTRSARRRCWSWSLRRSAAGRRLAGPGEFTLRAFLAGRIDLTQAEAVLGVIDAAGPRELDIALGQLAGGLARPLHGLRDALLDLLAHLEAGFDFADEDLPFITRAELDRQLAEAETQRRRRSWPKWPRAASRPTWCGPCWSGGRTPARAACSTPWPASRGAGLGPSRHDARLSHRRT